MEIGQILGLLMVFQHSPIGITPIPASSISSARDDLWTIRECCVWPQ